jgi:hypothetical protein
MGCGGSAQSSAPQLRARDQTPPTNRNEDTALVLHVVPLVPTGGRRGRSGDGHPEEQGKVSSHSSGSHRSSSSRSKGDSSIGSPGPILRLLPEDNNEEPNGRQVVPPMNGKKSAKNPLQPPSSAGPTPISRDLNEVTPQDDGGPVEDGSESPPLPVLVNAAQSGTEHPPRLDNSQSSGAASGAGMIQLLPVVSNHATSPLPVWGEEYAALHTPILNPLPGDEDELGESQNAEDPNTHLTSRILASPLFTDVMKNSIVQWIDTCIAASLGAALVLPSYGSTSTLDDESLNTEESSREQR